MTRLKQLIDKWKADLICINNEYELAFEYGATIAASDFNGRRNQLKACISEAEQLLQDTVTGEGREENKNTCDIPGCGKIAPQNDIFCVDHRY